MRQIVLDTETTGLEWSQDHRIIEIGCVELVNRRLTGRHFHRYINPERDIDVGAMEVHGITQEDLDDKPVFKSIASDFIDFIDGAELVIHNAPFDIGFINYEFSRMSREDLSLDRQNNVIDTLILARQLHPGQRNSLDALCRRYGVDNSQRTLHGALLDAEILADVYLLMTGGQASLSLGGDEARQTLIGSSGEVKRIRGARRPLKVVYADASELERHAKKIIAIEAISGQPGLWPVVSTGDK